MPEVTDPFPPFEWHYVRAGDPVEDPAQEPYTGALTLSQRARAEALSEARYLLGREQPMVRGWVPPPMAELLSVAWFILEGPVPLPGEPTDE